jgi:hypothetical protein
MFEPEIDRRCMSCGATVRKQAAFCPQCGQMLDQSNAEPHESPQTETELIEAQKPTQLTTDDGADDNQQPVTDSSAIQEAAASIEPSAVRRDDGSGDGTEPSVTVHDAPSAYKTQPLFANPTLANATAAGLADASLKRPTNAPTRSDNRVLTPGDRIRKVSSVIDQAAYDPSLRFLLVAGVLFVVFVILMILSKVLG